MTYPFDNSLPEYNDDEVLGLLGTAQGPGLGLGLAQGSGPGPGARLASGPGLEDNGTTITRGTTGSRSQPPPPLPSTHLPPPPLSSSSSLLLPTRGGIPLSPFSQYDNHSGTAPTSQTSQSNRTVPPSQNSQSNRLAPSQYFQSNVSAEVGDRSRGGGRDGKRKSGRDGNGMKSGYGVSGRDEEGERLPSRPGLASGQGSRAYGVSTHSPTRGHSNKGKAQGTGLGPGSAASGPGLVFSGIASESNGVEEATLLTRQGLGLGLAPGLGPGPLTLGSDVITSQSIFSSSTSPSSTAAALAIPSSSSSIPIRRSQSNGTAPSQTSQSNGTAPSQTSQSNRTAPDLRSVVSTASSTVHSHNTLNPPTTTIHSTLSHVSYTSDNNSYTDQGKGSAPAPGLGLTQGPGLGSGLVSGVTRSGQLPGPLSLPNDPN